MANEGEARIFHALPMFKKSGNWKQNGKILDFTKVPKNLENEGEARGV